MGNINKSRNLFLEKEELNRWDKFFFEDGLTDYIKNSIQSAGIVSKGGLQNQFKVIDGSSFPRITFQEGGVAYDTEGNRIYFDFPQSTYEWLLPFSQVDPTTQYVYMEYSVTKIEEGKVTLSANGEINGTNTKFTEVFRGASTLVPNKIRLYSRSEVNTGGSGYSYSLIDTYEVSEVVGNTNMFVNTINAVAGDLYYSVVGAFSPGTFDDTREETIYTYDFIGLGFSETSPTLTDNQFLLAKIDLDPIGSLLDITDLRKDIFVLKLPETASFNEITTEKFSTNNVSFTGGNIRQIINSNDNTTPLTLSSGTTYDPLPLLDRENYTNVVILVPTLDVSIGTLSFNGGVTYGETIKIYNGSDFDITFLVSTSFLGFNMSSDYVLEPKKWVELQFSPSAIYGANYWTLFAPQ